MVRTTAFLLAGLLLAGCATTSFKSTWKAPGAGPVDYSGKKIAAVFVSAEEGTRRAAEDTLAHAISARGAQGVAAYDIVSLDDLKDDKGARSKLLQAGCTGAVMMRVVDVEKEVDVSPASWSGPHYTSFSGYSRYGWGTVYEPAYVSTNTIVSVETLVYDLNEDELLWAGTSETFNPSKTRHFVEELAEAAADEMRSEGLIQK